MIIWSEKLFADFQGAGVIGALASVPLAFVSFRFVETVFREGRGPRPSKGNGLRCRQALGCLLQGQLLWRSP